MTLKFKARVDYWRPEQKGGLAVAYVPTEYIAKLGGLKQKRVHGRINNADFKSSVWPAGSGRLALNVTKKMMSDAKVQVGGDARFEVQTDPSSKR